MHVHMHLEFRMRRSINKQPQYRNAREPLLAMARNNEAGSLLDSLLGAPHLDAKSAISRIRCAIGCLEGNNDTSWHRSGGISKL